MTAKLVYFIVGEQQSKKHENANFWHLGMSKAVFIKSRICHFIQTIEKLTAKPLMVFGFIKYIMLYTFKVLDTIKHHFP